MAEIVMMSTGGGGSGGYFRFNKSLPTSVENAISNVEALFHHIFKHISYFQESLDRQQGKAANALKRNLNTHLETMSKSAPVLLHFADVMKTFMQAIQATDDGSIYPSMIAERSKWHYSLSLERIEEEIRLEAGSLKSASLSFKANLANVKEVFTLFNGLLEAAMDGLYLPWNDLSGMWSETKRQVKSIVEKTEEHIEILLREATAFVKEISRVDHMAAQQMLA